MSVLTFNDIMAMVQTLQTEEEWHEFMEANEIDRQGLSQHISLTVFGVLNRDDVDLVTAMHAVTLSSFLVGWKCGQKKMAEMDFPDEPQPGDQ